MSDFYNKCPDNIKRLIDELRNLIEGSIYDGHVFIVGGMVRDVLLGKQGEIKDVDMVIDISNGGTSFATWLAFNTGCLKLGSNPCLFPTYGTAKVQILTNDALKDIEIECVQTRKEKYYKDSRNPSTVFGTIEEDAERRDLTINALYYSITDDEVFDVNGNSFSDLQRNILRTTGKPDDVFFDDALRVLRVIRFSTKLGWRIEKETWVGMVMNAERITMLSQERITDEINKMLLCDKPSRAINMMDRCGVLELVLPVLEETKHIYHKFMPLKTLYEHTLEVLDNTPAVLETRLAALLHEIGKVETIEKNFDGCCEKSAEMAEEILRLMKYPNTVTKTVRKAIEHHNDLLSQPRKVAPKPRIIRRFVSQFGGNDKDLNTTMDLIHADMISDSFTGKETLIPLMKEKIEKLDAKGESGKNIKLPITGEDIMSEFGIKPGKMVGLMMNFAREKVLDNPKITKTKMLEYLKKKYIEKVV